MAANSAAFLKYLIMELPVTAKSLFRFSFHDSPV